MGTVHTTRTVVTGKSGSGKSTYAGKLIAHQRAFGHVEQVIIVNRKTEHADLCEARWTVTGEGNPRDQIVGRDSVFFHVVAPDPKPFVEKLCRSLLEFRFPRLIVFDEAQNFTKRGAVADALLRVNLEGRDALLNALYVTPLVKGANSGVDLSILDQSTHMTVFRTQGEGNLSRIYEDEFFPELKNQAHKLAMPHGGPSEYATKNRDTNEAVAMLRTQQSDGRFSLYPKDITQEAEGGAFQE